MLDQNIFTPEAAKKRTRICGLIMKMNHVDSSRTLAFVIIFAFLFFLFTALSPTLIEPMILCLHRR